MKQKTDIFLSNLLHRQFVNFAIYVIDHSTFSLLCIGFIVVIGGMMKHLVQSMPHITVVV